MARRAAAFFDFDKTLLDVETSRLLIQYIGAHRRIIFGEKRLSLLYLLKLILANELYKRHRFSDEKMAYLLIAFFRGRRPALFEAIGPELYRESLKPHLAPNLMTRLEEHRRQGHRLVLLSAGLRYTLASAASDLGFDHLLCTELAVGPDGLFTGKPAGDVCIDVHKRTLALRLAQTHAIDLSASSAYGNHHSDIPLLEIVGHPVAVEPTVPLSQVARARGWPILSYR